MAFTITKPKQFLSHMMTVKTWNGEKKTEDDFREWFAKQTTNDLKLMLTMNDGTLLYKGVLPERKDGFATVMAKAMIKAKAPACAPSKKDIRAAMTSVKKPQVTAKSGQPTVSDIKKAKKAELEQMVADKGLKLPEGKYTRPDLIAMLI